MRTSRWGDGKFVAKAANRITWELEIEVLTPMFGGGVTLSGHKKLIDPITPIRVASIRGQLRFWWRAVNPRGCQTVKELREAETEIFGAASAAGALDLQLTGTAPSAEPYPVLDGEFGAVAIDGVPLKGVAYGAFPLRPKKEAEDKQNGTLHQLKGSFKLRLSFAPQIEAQVQAALTAWLHFGGVGGRTRRGFGAVNLLDGGEFRLPPADGSWWPKGNLTQRAWPTLPAASEGVFSEVRSGQTKPILALNEFLAHLQRLRQGEGLGRTKRENGSKTPGRSYWPEADSIRKLSGKSSRAHSRRLTRSPEFPRAAFGTPIIFHFKDRDDPSDSTLNPMDRGRLASPLVLRPARLASGQLVLRALRLDHPAPVGGFGLMLKGERQAIPVSDKSPDPDWGLDGRPSPLMKGDFRTTDPIARFFKEFDK